MLTVLLTFAYVVWEGNSDFVDFCFRDVVMEAKLNELVGWACNICSHPVPHLHVHKVILQSGCDYLQGLFRSGMQER
jgi:hypothetical protein